MRGKLDDRLKEELENEAVSNDTLGSDVDDKWFNDPRIGAGDGCLEVEDEDDDEHAIDDNG